MHDTASTALVALHRYDEAIERARRGAAQAGEILKRQPGYRVGRDRASRGSTAPAYVAGMDHFGQGLKLAGLPAGPPSATPPVTGSR